MSLGQSGEGKGRNVYGKLGQAKFDAAYQLHRGNVRAHLRSLGVQNNEDAEEATNDAFVNALQSDPEDTSQLVRNTYAKTQQLAVDHHRRETTQSRGSGQEPLSIEDLRSRLAQDGPTHVPDFAAPRGIQPEQRAIARQTIEEALEPLSRREREAVIRTAAFGESRVEAASSLGVTPNTVKTLLQRARAKLPNQEG